MTAEELLKIPDKQFLELVRGELVKISPRGMKGGHIVARLGSLVSSFVEQRKLGFVGISLDLCTTVEGMARHAPTQVCTPVGARRAVPNRRPFLR